MPYMFENHRRGRQARKQMFRKLWISNRLPNRYFPKLTLGAPDATVVVENLHAHIALRTVFSTIVT